MKAPIGVFVHGKSAQPDNFMFCLSEIYFFCIYKLLLRMMRKQQHACFFGDLTKDIVGKMTGALVTKLCNLAGALTFKISVLTGSNYSIT